MLCTCAASTQLAPVSTAPADSSRRGPNFSIRKPWNGEKKVWMTIRTEKVTCNSASETPSAAPSGLVNRVQTYCELEIDIMQMTPKPNCSQRNFDDDSVMTSLFSVTGRVSKRRASGKAAFWPLFSDFCLKGRHRCLLWRLPGNPRTP